jgi:hypothetical protein
LELQEHLLFGTLAKGVIQKHHLTARPFELFQYHDLVGIVAGQPVRGTEQDDLKRSLADPIPEPIESRAIETRPAVTIIYKEKLGGEVIAALGRGVLQSLNLTPHALLLLLAIGGDPGIGGCPFPGSGSSRIAFSLCLIFLICPLDFV